MAGITAVKRIGFAGGGKDASKSDFRSSRTRSPGHPSNRTLSATTNRATSGGDRDNSGPYVTKPFRDSNKTTNQITKTTPKEKKKLNINIPNIKDIYDYGKNYIRNRKKGIYNIVPNNPKRELEFLSSLQITDPARYDRLPQNLKDLLDDTRIGLNKIADDGSFKDAPKFSYDDFESLTQFDDGAFAKYAAERGSPGLSVAGDMSQVGMKYVQRDPLTGKPMKDMFGNTLFGYGPPEGQGGGGGGQNYLPLNYGAGVGPVEEEKETQEFVFDPSRFGAGAEAADVTRASYVFNQGGRVPKNMGGIMNAVPRQGYFLGKIVKGVKKVVGGVADAAGKVLKSDVGKMALLAAGAYYAPAMFGGTTGFGAGSTYGNFARGLMNPNLIGPMTKAGSLGRTISNFAINNKALTAGILGIGASAFMPTKVDQMPDGMSNRGGRLIDPITGEQATPAQMRASIESAKEEADGDPIKLAELNQKYNNMLFTNLPYENYGLYANGGRIGFAGGGGFSKNDLLLLEKYKFNPKEVATYLDGGKELLKSLKSSESYVVKAMGGRINKAEGGLMDLGGMEKDYRAEGGFVPIGKQEKADDVPARLSVNEFVFTADAVRNAGGGDIDRGAEVMENMMKNLENGGRVSEESQGNAGAQDMFSVSERIGEVI